MTDEIIIDSIDVSKCECFNPKFEGCHCYNMKEECYAINPNEHKSCKGVNCDYKQLKRKEQECEKLKAQVDEWEEKCNNNFELVTIRTKLLTDIAIKLGKDVLDKIDKFQSKEQECEERLKKYLKGE